MFNKTLSKLYDIFEKEKKLHPTLRSYFVVLFMGALSAAVFTALRADPAKSQALAWFDIVFSAMATTLIGVFILAILYASAVFWKASQPKPEATVLEEDDPEEYDNGALHHACVRLSRLIKKIDYKQIDTPLGIRFDHKTTGTAVIQWSLNNRVEIKPISEVAEYLENIIDRLELELAIPIDEDAGYTAP